jgi:DNA-binding SARP family transcriptional activator
MDVSFQLLGPVQVRAGNHEVPLRGQRQLRVLAMLLLTPDQSLSLRRLIDGVWDDDPPATAKRQLQNSLSMLRRDLGAPVIVSGRAGYRLQLDRDQVDARVFQDRVAGAAAARREGRLIDAVARLRGALGIWRGPALTGCTGRSMESAAAQLDEQRLGAIEQCLDLELTLGRHDQLVGEIAGLVATHPLRERLVGQLMLALHRSGRQAEALEAYQRLRLQLGEDLGLEPGDEVARLHQAVLRNEAGRPQVRGRIEIHHRHREFEPRPRRRPVAARHFVGGVMARRSLPRSRAVVPRGGVMVDFRPSCRAGAKDTVTPTLDRIHNGERHDGQPACSRVPDPP